MAAHGGRSSLCCCSYLKKKKTLCSVYKQVHALDHSCIPAWLASALPPMEPTGPSSVCHWKRKFPSTIPRAQGGVGVFWRKYQGRSRASGWAQWGPFPRAHPLAVSLDGAVYAVNQVLFYCILTRRQLCRHRMPAAVAFRFPLGRSEGERL